MKPLYIALVILLAALQYQLWWGDGSIQSVNQLKSNASMEQARLKTSKEYNNVLLKKIDALKTDKDEIENMARLEYNMVKEDEVYFQIVNTP